MSIPRVILTKPEDCPECLDRLMLNSYQTAEYRMFVGDKEWVLRHAENHLLLEAWIQQSGLTGLAIITAYNPCSELLEETENRRRNTALKQKIKVLGLPFGPALNRSADGEWPEPGFWVANIRQEEAMALGRQFGQAAVVWVGE